MFDQLLMTKGLDRAMRALHTHRAVLALDATGRILAINQCYLRLTGYVRDELLDQPVWVLFGLGERCAGRMNDLLAIPAQQGAHLPELAHISKSGRHFRVDARIFGINDERGGRALTLLFARPEEAGRLIDLRHAFGGCAMPDELVKAPQRCLDH
ncbi:PAS domain-containing protein [Paracoccus laeviglucosivorans]|uniref:PAS domain S-box-containing protein n=1 Tax=Paracoccus laeviglucosivorans TaxID=1197861 RepID=A0A521CPB1_9RHOB|nr:PAS domain-containing protein [Paracoccus laeviglucosivorans]SMO61292.1 PAS domain S-box-containing protein [Paracoccus laeviglucosivorans]